MASTTSSFTLFSLIIIISFAFLQVTMAGDPDIITDFILPANASQGVDGSFFTFTGLRTLLGADPLSFK